MRYRISILYILPAQHHILHKSHYIYLCFGYTVDIPNLGPWSPLITQAMVQQELYYKGMKLQVWELKRGLRALGAALSGRKCDLVQRWVALKVAAGRQTHIEIAVEVTASASAEAKQEFQLDGLTGKHHMKRIGSTGGRAKGTCKTRMCIRCGLGNRAAVHRGEQGGHKCLKAREVDG